MGNTQSLILLGWWVLCFLVPACVHCPVWVVGVGACFWVRHKRFIADKHTVGFTFNTVLASAALVGGGCPHNQPGVLVWVVCGGLFVICIVVASIFVLYCFLCFV